MKGEGENWIVDHGCKQKNIKAHIFIVQQLKKYNQLINDKDILNTFRGITYLSFGDIINSICFQTYLVFLG